MDAPAGAGMDGARAAALARRPVAADPLARRALLWSGAAAFPISPDLGSAASDG